MSRFQASSYLARLISRIVGYYRMNDRIINGLHRDLNKLFTEHSDAIRIIRNNQRVNNVTSNNNLEAILLGIHKSFMIDVIDFVRKDLLMRLRHPDDKQLESFYQAIVFYVRREIGNMPSQDVANAISNFEVELLSLCEMKLLEDFAVRGDNLYSKLNNLIYSTIGGIIGALITQILNWSCSN